MTTDIPGALHAFFDRDVFIKLACCGLWDEAVNALGVTHPYRLYSASVRGAKTPLRRMEIDDSVREATFERLAVMAEQVPVVPPDWVAGAVSNPLYKRLSDTNGINIGEAELTLVALHCAFDNALITGDKRYIASLAVSFPDEFRRLKARMVTFERCLLAICDAYGYDSIKPRLWVARGCDGTLRIALGSQGQADYSSFKEGLLSGALV